MLISILSTLTKLLNSFSNMESIFIPIGQKFLALALMITIANAMYQFWIKGDIQEMIASGIRMAMVTAIPLFMLTNGQWATQMNKVDQFFVTGLVASVAPDASSGSTTPEQVVGKMLTNLMNSADIKDNGGTANLQSKIDANNAIIANLNLNSFSNPKQSADNQASVDALTKANTNLEGQITSSGGSPTGFWHTLGAAIDPATYYSLFLHIAVWTLTVLLAAAVIFAVYMPLASIKIGIIMGPLLLAWLPWEGLSDMSKKWISFMIANGMTYVVAIVIMNGVAETVNAMAANVQTASNSSLFGGLGGFGAALIGTLATYIFSMNLMLQANNMASGMTGGTSIGEGLFGKMASSAAAGGMGAVAAAGAIGAAKGAKGAVAGGIGATGAISSAAGRGFDAGGRGDLGRAASKSGAAFSKAAASVSSATIGSTAKGVGDMAKSAGKAIGERSLRVVESSAKGVAKFTKPKE